MNRLLSAKPLLAAAVALGGLGLASAAQARTDVFLSLGVPVYSQPAPVYVQPAPVYSQPTPVYVQPTPVYAQPGVVYYGQERGWREHEWREREWRRHHEHRDGPWGDADHDGVPNRYDRAPMNPYRR